MRTTKSSRTSTPSKRAAPLANAQRASSIEPNTTSMPSHAPSSPLYTTAPACMANEGLHRAQAWGAWKERGERARQEKDPRAERRASACDERVAVERPRRLGWQGHAAAIPFGSFEAASRAAEQNWGINVGFLHSTGRRYIHSTCSARRIMELPGLHLQQRFRRPALEASHLPRRPHSRGASARPGMARAARRPPRC